MDHLEIEIQIQQESMIKTSSKLFGLEIKKQQEDYQIEWNRLEEQKKEMEKKENELDQSNLFCLDHEQNRDQRRD